MHNDKYTDPALHVTIKKHMLRRPCEKYNSKSLCMVNGVYRFHYPRPFSSKTIGEKYAYSIYKRKNDAPKGQFNSICIILSNLVTVITVNFLFH